MRKIAFIALAYVGVLTGAGLASGQELLQYFTAFGSMGLIGVLITGLLHALFGGMILQLGSYYRADDHSSVLSEITHPIVEKFLDLGLIITCFIVGFVMIAGAGSNLNQQFGISPWIGSTICTVMTIVIGQMNFEKVTKIIGTFTPFIIAFILLAAGVTLVGFDGDIASLDQVARTIPTNLPNWWLSVLNYFAMCMITGTSMAFVLGGSVLYPGNARKAGRIGGGIVGLITIVLGFTIFAEAGAVKDADLPLQFLVSRIHPILGFIMSLVIYGMIFNTCISLFYALASRFSGGDEKKFKILLVSITFIGYLVSFFGFKTLLSVMYPLLGYAGMVLIAAIFVGWLKKRGDFKQEGKLRRLMVRLLQRKHQEDKVFTEKDQNRLEKIADTAQIDLEDIEGYVAAKVEQDNE
uniref:YkvI family membrane protein n=1 Tax=Ndongobacter massiliensis TaxID=1871025 RepID=UPI000AF13F28|nr:hypothetical protein [Ndongobacter massiliensis]